jgi:Amt family ammonium transporter
VRRGIRPGTTWIASVGLDLDDDPAHTPPGEGRAKQSMGGLDRVDKQLVCRRAPVKSHLDHPPNLPARRTWQYRANVKGAEIMHAIDPAATAWLLASTALVLLMTPGLAIFYGGMVRTTGVLNMIMMSFISIPLVTVAWLLVGYTIAFSEDGASGFLGNLSHVGMVGITPDSTHGAVPELLYATFQLAFAIITAALVSGAIADRAKFAAWMVFVPVWAIVVYSVVAHWVWGPGGWLAKLGVLDYAGGLVVEIVSGSSALALALVLGPRIGFKKDSMRPHNLPFVLLGVGLLWFGWFGFNAGSALAANGLAAAIFLNTLVAGCLGMLGWLAVEQIRDGRPTTFGAASGVVAGLVAITPSCGTVNTLGATVVGLAAAPRSHLNWMLCR